MDPLISIRSIGNWFNNHFVTTTYEHRKYEEGNSVMKVTHRITAEVYDKKGNLDVYPRHANNVDVKS
jgi:hypothetical protein